MSRKQEIENIIIGTLINGYDEYWDSVKYCITPNMISDDLNRRLFKEMSAGSKNLVELSHGKTDEETLRIVDLAADCDFDWKKWLYNSRQHWFGNPPKYTDVTFDDYVSRFVKLYYGEN